MKTATKSGDNVFMMEQAALQTTRTATDQEGSDGRFAVELDLGAQPQDAR